jgi:quercetin dioxygenase-like cupin family protein
MTEQEWLEQLNKEGYSQRCFAHSFEPNQEMLEHTHDVATVHVILEGELILIEKDGNKTIKAGERIEIPAGTTHSAKAGPNGLRMIVGEK